MVRPIWPIGSVPTVGHVLPPGGAGLPAASLSLTALSLIFSLIFPVRCLSCRPAPPVLTPCLFPLTRWRPLTPSPACLFNLRRLLPRRQTTCVVRAWWLNHIMTLSLSGSASRASALPTDRDECQPARPPSLAHPRIWP